MTGRVDHLASGTILEAVEADVVEQTVPTAESSLLQVL